MTRPRVRSIRSKRAAFITALLLAAPGAMASHGASTPQDRAIGVHDGRYVTAGQTYTTLDALEVAVRAARPASLSIVACTPTATRSWLSAVPRFEDLPMHLDVSNGASPACEATLPVSMGASASAEPEPAVRQYWNQRMP
jgi:hypothetical protein